MAPAQFPCSQCIVLDDSEIESHISTQHLDYLPLECTWCKETDQKYLAATKKHMTQHMAISHNGKNSRYSVSEDYAKEVELKKLAKECRILANDSKSAFRRVLAAATSTGNVAQNGYEQDDDDIIVLEDDKETATIPDDSLGNNLSEKEQQAECIAKIETGDQNELSVARPNVSSENNEVSHAVLPKAEPSEIESLLPPAIATRPTAIIETGQFVVDPIANPEHNDTASALTLIKTEPSETASTVPIGLRLQAALSSFVPIDVEVNENQCNPAATTTRLPSIFCEKRSHLNDSSGNLVESPKERISNIAAMDNGTKVEVFKFLNYCQLAKSSLVSKRFRDLIQTHRHKLALLYVYSLVMRRRYGISAAMKIFNKELSPEEYNDWVVRNNYSNQSSLKRQAAGSRPNCELRAYGDYKDPTQESTYVFFAHAKELNDETWPLFEHFVRLLTDPFIYIRYLGLINQADVLKLLATKIDRSNRGRLHCEILGLKFEGNVQNPLNWIKEQVRCASFQQSIPVSCCSAYRRKQLFDFFATGSRCTSEIVVIDSHISKAVIVDFVQNFMELKNCDESHIVNSIRGNLFYLTAEALNTVYEQFIIKKEQNRGTTTHFLEFVNVVIRKKFQLSITEMSYHEPCPV